jgi:hypothetical protein
MAVTPETVRQQIVDQEERIRQMKEQVENAVGSPQLLLVWELQLVELQRQLTTLQQKELLLMQQQAGAVSRSAPDSLHQLLIKQACSNQRKQQV